VLTLFTIPKPFTGVAAAAQRNALRSWRALGRDVQIVLFADEEGTAAVGAEVAADHVLDIGRNEWGTPLVSEAFARAADLARHSHLCYANADIVLFPDLLVALERVRDRPALVVGRRVDLDVGRELDLDPGWEARLRRSAETSGLVGTERQIDYMLYPRPTRWDMPPFAVGRPGWDNWLLYRARLLELMLVDASRVVLAVHQRHGYEHVPVRRGSRWDGPEADANRALAAEMGRGYGILDATHLLTERALLPALGPRHLKRRLRRHPLLGQSVRVIDAIFKR
jgi:hypothetical protein